MVHVRGGGALRGVGLAALLDQVHNARLATPAGRQRGQLLPHLIGLRNPPGDHLPQQDPQAEHVDLQHHMPSLSQRCSWGSERMRHGRLEAATPSLHDPQPRPRAGQPLERLVRLQKSVRHSPSKWDA